MEPIERATTPSGPIAARGSPDGGLIELGSATGVGGTGQLFPGCPQGIGFHRPGSGGGVGSVGPGDHGGIGDVQRLGATLGDLLRHGLQEGAHRPVEERALGL